MHGKSSRSRAEYSHLPLRGSEQCWQWRQLWHTCAQNSALIPLSDRLGPETLGQKSGRAKFIPVPPDLWKFYWAEKAVVSFFLS